MLPTVVIAGLSGDAGKTLVTAGIARALARRAIRVAPFKKGPDFIDAAWLGAAAGKPGRNLDTWMMSPSAIAASLQRASRRADLALIEGNRGLFDGVDACGSHSTAELAKLVGAPVVLVIDASKSTRTVAALAAGVRAYDPDLSLAGVILNRVGTARQERVIREALLAIHVPVLGSIPRLEGELLPSRHLGLVCAGEHPRREAVLDAIGSAIAVRVDLNALAAIAAQAKLRAAALLDPPRRIGPRARIGVLRDAAFSFYYPENLEALESAGAEIVPISPLHDRALPAVDALYAGGGFPEEYAPVLSDNEPLRLALRAALCAGLPAWAECGGLMYLSRAIVRDGREHPMVGALPIAVEFEKRPQGHGYVGATVDRENPFFEAGTVLRGHEFHYSRAAGELEATAFSLEKGTGLGGGRDGLVCGNAVATYTHLHALGTPEWAPALVDAARRHAPRRTA